MFGVRGLPSSFGNPCTTFRPRLWSVRRMITSSISLLWMRWLIKFALLMISPFTSWSTSGRLALCRDRCRIIIHSGPTILNCVRLMCHFHIGNRFEWIRVTLLCMWIWNASWCLLWSKITVFSKSVPTVVSTWLLLSQLFHPVSIRCCIHAISQTLHILIYLRNQLLICIFTSRSADLTCIVTSIVLLNQNLWIFNSFEALVLLICFWVRIISLLIHWIFICFITVRPILNKPFRLLRIMSFSILLSKLLYSS